MRFVAVLSAAHALNIEESSQNSIAAKLETSADFPLSIPNDETLQQSALAMAPNRDELIQAHAELSEDLDKIQEVFDTLV